MGIRKEQSSPAVTIRELSTFEEYHECVDIQKETWGDEFEEWVPTSILKVSQKIGGIVAGAYDANNRMIGFVYGLTGVKDGKPVHWSHMLAVRNEARGLGLGKRLKLYQRDLLLRRGIGLVYWTFDPLVARNANLNFNGLGTTVTEYVKDMYVESHSILHRGMSMDRFIVAWHLENERVAKALSGKPVFSRERYRQAPVVNTREPKEGAAIPADLELPLGNAVRVEIPTDIETVKSASVSLAVEWRANTRRVFLWYQDHGYEIDGFYVDSTSRRSFYCLTQRKQP